MRVWFCFGSCYVDQPEPRLGTVFLLLLLVFLVTVGLKISVLPSIVVYAYNLMKLRLEDRDVEGSLDQSIERNSRQTKLNISLQI